MDPSSSLSFEAPLIFVEGKGGVGKSTVAEALARALAQQGRRVLWVIIDDPLLEKGATTEIARNLWRHNLEAFKAFEEYAGIKIGVPALAKVFLSNALVRYLVKAAPGIPELVQMGKIWYERKRYDHVVVDMPSTGHGITMFESLNHWHRLFSGSPIAKDAASVLETLRDPKMTRHLVVAIPEEMPLVEALELRGHLLRLFPQNAPRMLVNRLLPGEPAAKISDSDPPLAINTRDYAERRVALERENLATWRNAGFPFQSVPYLSPAGQGMSPVSERLAPLLIQSLSKAEVA